MNPRLPDPDLPGWFLALCRSEGERLEKLSLAGDDPMGGESEAHNDSE